jgi:hypothetical protein
MDTLVRNFLDRYIDDSYTLIRLADRHKRRGLNGHRKAVYLVVDVLGQKSILLHFSDKYRIIFDNYLLAKEVILKGATDSEWVVDKTNLFILMPYLGEVLPLNKNQSLVQIIRFLKKIYESHNIASFEVPRYLTDLLRLNSEKQKFSFIQLERLLRQVGEGDIKYSSGFGVLDPSFRNFTHLEDRVYLVDLDNFSKDINLDYEIGFLLADTDLELESKFALDLDNYLQMISKMADMPLEPIPFWIGYVSRIATNLVDILRGERDLGPQDIEIVKTIEEISDYLLKIR